MEEIRVKLLQKQQKKVDAVINDLAILLDAQKHVAAKTGKDMGVCAEIHEAIGQLRNAYYSLILAEAASEDQQMVGQMMADLDKFAQASAEV